MLGIDPLEDALNDLRISGSVLIHERYASTWAIAVPDEARLRRMLGVGGDMRVVPFHLARRGGCDLFAAGAAALRLDAPELSLMLGGAAHTLSVGSGAQAVALEAVIAGKGPARPGDGAVDVTELICGIFVARAAPHNPLFGALPTILKVKAGGEGASAALAGVAELLAAELGRRPQSGYTASRLLEILCAEAIRAYQADTSEIGKAGWLRALADPKISKTLRRIHAAPGEAWTVDRLAEGAALSASRFAARFKATVGETAMGYVARWRVNLACRLLRETDLPLMQLAEQVGYDSLAAFSRAFKGRVGVPPGEWRRTGRAKTPRAG